MNLEFSDDEIQDIEQIISNKLASRTEAPIKDNDIYKLKKSKKSNSKRRPRISDCDQQSYQPKSSSHDQTSQKFSQQRALSLATIQTRANSVSIKDAQQSNLDKKTPATFRDLNPSRKRKKSKSSKHENSNLIKSEEKYEEIKSVANFVEEHRREIGQYGSQGLHKREKQKFQQAELLRLGCRKPKPQKMPIATLIRKRQIQKSRNAKKKEIDLATGMLVRSRR